jgi:putative ABC transport system ATP-binding protein
VAIARALAANPPIIMADEPTAALDSHSGHAVIELLVKLAKEGGRTVLIVTHDPRIVDIADRVLYLEDGMLKS